MRALFLPAAISLLCACGDGGNNATNAATNGTNTANNATNTATNGTNTATNSTNTATNNTAPGELTVDLAVNVNGRMTQLTSCAAISRDGGWSELGTDSQNGEPSGRFNCAVAEEGSFTAFFIVVVWFTADAVGTNQAADLNIGCSGNGCSGTVLATVRYQDGAAGILEGGLVTGADATGTFTLDTFDTTTGDVAGSMDLTSTPDGQTLGLSGTFSGTLGPCRSIGGCL